MYRAKPEYPPPLRHPRPVLCRFYRHNLLKTSKVVQPKICIVFFHTPIFLSFCLIQQFFNSDFLSYYYKKKKSIVIAYISLYFFKLSAKVIGQKLECWEAGCPHMRRPEFRIRIRAFCLDRIRIRFLAHVSGSGF